MESPTSIMDSDDDRVDTFDQACGRSIFDKSGDRLQEIVIYDHSDDQESDAFIQKRPGMFLDIGKLSSRIQARFDAHQNKLIRVEKPKV